jgi:D-amino-acid oxidase
MVSYHVFRDLAAKDLFGVRMRTSMFLFSKRIANSGPVFDKMRAIETSGVVGFKRIRDPTEGGGLYEDAYEFLSPVIDTDSAMNHIRQYLEKRKVTFIEENVTFKKNLLDIEKQLLETYGACAIVNATGLGARITADDPKVYGLAGTVLRYHNTHPRNSDFQPVQKALIVSAIEGNTEDTTYVMLSNSKERCC